MFISTSPLSVERIVKQLNNLEQMYIVTRWQVLKLPVLSQQAGGSSYILIAELAAKKPDLSYRDDSPIGPIGESD